MADNVFLSQHTTPQLGLNINDVIEIIKDQEDKTLIEQLGQEMSLFGVGVQSEANYSVLSSVTQSEPGTDPKKNAYVQITEQPQPKALRFRYICEGRSAGSIPGVSSTSENKTYPAIKVCNYKGHAFVVVSCVTAEPPYRPHPHNLVGKSCKNGICTMKITNDSMECMFSNLGIQCVKKKEVDRALEIREEQRVDPFRTGFAHRNQSQSINLNVVRLCFQVFLEGKEKGKFTYPLTPVVTEPIFDRKSTSDLVICKLSDCTSTVCGGKEIILLCEKVTKEDIQIRFFEIKDDMINWEAFGDFQAADVHKQVAISFKTPKYKDIEIQSSVKVSIQLLRPSDGSVSEPRPFEYLPMDSGSPFRSLKRLKNNYGLFHRILGLEGNSNPVSFNEDVLPHKKVSNSAPIKPTAMVTEATSETPVITLSPSPPPVLSPPENKTSPIKHLISSPSPPVQSVPDIKERMTAGFDRKRIGAASIARNFPSSDSKNRSLWNDDLSIYSGADILEEVLSQGSVNDILSAVGEEITVYEDLANQQKTEVLPDTIYGDASYASCYSNLEFVLGRAKASHALSEGLSSGNNNIIPQLPPKIKDFEEENDDDGAGDFAIYGTPSGRPIHPNKESLLRERGFLSAASQEAKKSADDSNLFYTPVSDILEMDEENENISKDLNVQDLPKSILDLFV